LPQNGGGGGEGSEDESEMGHEVKKRRRREEEDLGDEPEEEVGEVVVDMVAHDKVMSDDDDEADAEKAKEDRPAIKATTSTMGGTIDIFSSSPVLGGADLAGKGGVPASKAIQGMTNQDDTLEVRRRSKGAGGRKL